MVGAYEDHAVSGASRHGRLEFQRLVADAKARRFEVVLCEALDRLGRKLAEIAEFYDQMAFLGIPVHSVQHGVITPMHIGLLGTMAQMQLADIRSKTTRGLRAVAKEGRSAGGLCYGYRVDAGGDREGRRGYRVVDDAEAAVVRRIFRDYANGLSPKRIALALNAEGVPGPRGGSWAPTAINGARAKGTGILNNELYVGRQVWGRQTWLKDPSTGRRVARTAASDAQVVTEVPELRIVDDALWQAVKDRQALLDRRGREAGAGGREDAGGGDAFWAKQRPRYLFSGLMRCAECGGGFSKISATHFGCSTARNKGPTACANRLTIRRDTLEDTVLSALRERLMDPQIFKEFVAGFTETWNRLQAEASAGLAGRRQELARLEQQIARGVDAILAGTAPAALQERLTTLEARKGELEWELATTEAPAPRLHPNLAEVYRQRVAELSEALASDDGAEARELVRGLVDEIRLVPEGGVLRLEVRGELGAILRLAEGARAAGAAGGGLSGGGNAKRPSDVAEAFWVQIKMDAGTRNRRCQYIEVCI